MPVPSAISDLSTTADFNSPAGSESPAILDNILRAHASFIRQVSDAKDSLSSTVTTLDSANVKLTGDQTIAGTKTFSSAPVVPGINGGQLAGMRNKIINGSIKVDQRNAGASQTFTAAAALAYCADRFYGYCTGANITGQRIALSNGQNRYRLTGAASNTAVGFGHRIEAVNCLDLAGNTATFSVKLSSSSLTTITWTAYYANTTDTFGTLASPTRTQIATGTFTISSTEATYSTNISVPSAAGTGIEIVLTGGALLATQTLTIGDLQLEPGSVATPFEHRPYGAELALCQRYYELVSGFGIYTYVNSAATTTMVPVMFKVSKRASPTMGTPSAASVTNANTITTYAQTTEGFHFGANSVAAGVVQAWNATVTASAEL